MPEAPICDVSVGAYEIPTDAPESDGTLSWDSTTLVVVEIEAGGRTGLGYTYAHKVAGRYVEDKLAGVVEGREALDIPAAHAAMLHAVRNDGRPGLAACALSAVDTALWDLKGKLLELPLAALLGRVRVRMPLYGSGGFTSYDDARLAEQLGGWAEDGLRWVKMKVGRDPDTDPGRVETARRAIGPECGLFVDANGAYTRKEALVLAERFAEEGVSWFEEPVSSDDLAGLRLMRDRCPPGMDVSAGEYAYDPWYVRRMLEAQAVDVIQADATRCGGITGFLEAAVLAKAFQLPISSHCAPALHLAPCLAAPAAAHMEWFHDHVRIEHMLFDGAPVASQGTAAPDLSAPGLGLAFRRQDAARYAV